MSSIVSIAKTPKPPYYAVIFTALSEDARTGYNEMATKMRKLAELQEGFLGIESSEDPVEITVSYWKDKASISKWRENVEHQAAQKAGKEQWYRKYKVRIALVERDYEFGK